MLVRALSRIVLPLLLLSLLPLVLAGCCKGTAVRPDRRPGPPCRMETPEVKARTYPSCVRLQKIAGRSTAPGMVRVLFRAISCEGRPVPNLLNEDFEIYEDTGEIERYESQQTILPRRLGFRLSTLLLLDMSGSIIRSGHLPDLQKNALKLVDSIAANQRVAIAAFDGRPDLQQLVGYTSDKLKLSQAIKNLSSWKIVDPSTDLHGAMVKGLRHLGAHAARRAPTSKPADPTVSPVKPVARGSSEPSIIAGNLVVITDGRDQTGRVSLADAVRAVKVSPFAVYMVGVGGEQKLSVLRKLGKTKTLIADDWRGFSAKMTQITHYMQALSRAHYALAYCSPKRSGAHTVQLRLKHPRKQVARRIAAVEHTFDATGFGPGCSVGKNACQVLQCGKFGDADCGKCQQGFQCRRHVCVADQVITAERNKQRAVEDAYKEQYQRCVANRVRLRAAWRKYDQDRAADAMLDCGFRFGAAAGLALNDPRGAASTVMFGYRPLPWLEAHAGVGMAFPTVAGVLDVRYVPLHVWRFDFFAAARFAAAFTADPRTFELDLLLGARLRALRWLAFVAQLGPGWAYAKHDDIGEHAFIFPGWLGAELTW